MSDPQSSSLINSSLSGGDTLFNVAPGEVNLGIGAPDKATLQFGISLLHKVTQAMFSNPVESHYLLQYGPARGDGDFLKTLAGWLTRHYGEHAPAVRFEELLVTSGATSGLSLACTVFGLSGGGMVFMEDPAYFIAGKVFDDHRMNKVPVKTDAQGIDVAHLEQLLHEKVGIGTPRRAGQDYAALVYLVPTFNNPTGVVLTAERRKRLVELAQQFDLLVVCDDVYELLSYTKDQLPPRVVSFDQGKGHVISNGSFSKIFGPGCRLGWIEAREPIIKRLSESGIAASGGSLNHLTSGMVSTMIKLGYQDELLTKIKAGYARRLEAVTSTLRSEMPPSVSFTPPGGGFFIWVRLPEHVSAVELLVACKAADKVGFQPGNWSSITGSFKNYIRLSFGFYEEDTLVWAVKRIAHHLKKML